MHLHMSPAEVDQVPLAEVGWMNKQLVEYLADSAKWFSAGPIGFDSFLGPVDPWDAPAKAPSGLADLPFEG